MHFWDLITKYMQNEFSSVEFINEFVEDEKMEDHVKTDKQEEGKEQEE